MYSLKELTSERLEETERVWRTQMAEREGEILDSHYLRILDWFKRIVTKSVPTQTIAYALERDTSPGYACAMLELSHAQPRSNQPWLKVLSIHVEPRLDVAGDDAPIVELAGIAAYAIVESLGLTFEQYPAKKLKVWASTPLTRRFLEGIVANTVTLGEHRVSSHGNCLVIDRI